jgi:hypothetical protein
MATLILGLVSADRQDDVRLDLKGIRRIRRGREPGALGESGPLAAGLRVHDDHDLDRGEPPEGFDGTIAAWPRATMRASPSAWPRELSPVWG